MFQELNITFPRHTPRYTVARPPQPLSITYPLLALRRLRSAIARATVETASPPRTVTWDFSGEEAQPTTGLLCEAVAPFPVAAD